jgi:hypothetical protein
MKNIKEFFYTLIFYETVNGGSNECWLLLHSQQYIPLYSYLDKNKSVYPPKKSYTTCNLLL